jgi:type VI secretion system protein ImpA
MPSPPNLDFDQLLAPIAGDNPAGIDLREDRSSTSLYDKVKDARTTARELEKRQERRDTTKPDPDLDRDLRGLTPAWHTILDVAPTILAEKSKDLEITAFLIEAMLRLQGPAGLRDGLRLARGLVEAFWEQLYPVPDEDGIATRIAPLTGLIAGQERSEGTLVRPLRLVLLTEAGDVDPVTYADLVRAEQLEGLAGPEKAKRVAAGALTVEAFQAKVRQTPAEFYRTLYDDLTACRLEYEKLGGAMDTAWGRESPSTNNVREILDDLDRCIRQFVGPIVTFVVPQPEVAATEAEAAGPGPGAASAPAAATGVIATREDAFRALGVAADYFRRTEPQSLIPLVIDEAIRRARLPLSELLAELIPDDATRKQFFVMSGVRPPEVG